MAFVEIYVVTPEGDRYRAEVDDGADAYTLLQDLITELGLPTNEKGRPIEYRIKLVDSLELHRGVTVEIARDQPGGSVRRITKE